MSVYSSQLFLDCYGLSSSDLRRLDSFKNQLQFFTGLDSNSKRNTKKAASNQCWPYAQADALVFHPVVSSESRDQGVKTDGSNVSDWQCWIPELQADLTLGFGDQRLCFRVSDSNLQHELILRAIRGRNNSEGWRVLDATAGLMRDSALLAAGGFKVLACERLSLLAELQNQSLQFHRERSDYLKRLSIATVDSTELLRNWDMHPAKSDLGPEWQSAPEVVYLDPMYISGMKQTAGLKKEMVFLKTLNQIQAGAGEAQEAELLDLARVLAQKKVVVKRAPKAPPLAGVAPASTVSGKALRFDIYPA